ncbi:HAUS augmin-like complex [Mactra antiquata]
MNNSQLHQTSLVQGRLEESLFSPRRTVPQVSQPLTPERGPPAYSLDLSDSEYGEENSEYRSRYQKPDEVLCLDASRQTINPDVSEVDVRIGVDKSPVKIVCHSPSRLKHSLQQKQIIDSPENNKYHSKHQIKRIDNVRDDHIEPYTAVQAIPMTPPNERRVLQSLPSNLPQPNFSDSGGSEIIDRLDDKVSIVSDEETGSVKDVSVTNHKVNNERNKNGKMAPPSIKKEKRPDTAKKKKGRIIPSRYMQAAESKTKTSLSSKLDKSSFDKTSKISRSMETPASAKKTVRKVHKKNVRSTERPHTPEDQSMISTGGKTSTPTMDGSHLSHDMDIDASAIHPDVSIVAGETSKTAKGNKTGSGKTKSRLRTNLHDDLMGQSVLSNVSVCNQSIFTSKPKQKVDAKSMQQKLDLLYMYNLQWAFLEAKTKKTLHEQEQQAMAQIYGLHEEDEELRKLKADKEQKLARAKHTNMTDHLVEVQRQCLGPVISNLPTLEKQYSNLAYALDTTRHQIPTKDIHLPENENQFLGKLETELLESERVLGEITTMTRKDVPTIVDMGNAIVTMEKAVEEMEEELNKGKELLSATETLTMHECSLRVQDLQLQVQT